MRGKADMGKERILIVDDEPAILNVLSMKLKKIGYECEIETDGLRALQRIKGERFHLVMLDINMPYASGTAILKGIKRFDTLLPVIMISGMSSIELVRQTLREGAYDYLVKPIQSEDLELSVVRALDHGRLLKKDYDHQRWLETEIRKRTEALEDALSEIAKTYDDTILALGSALESHDIETQQHCQRVAKYSLLLAETLGITCEDKLTDIERGAYLHDIGKIGVPDYILQKQDKLTDDEWKIIQTHPAIGKTLVENIDFLNGAVPIVYCHHERYDGSGYPNGMRGKEIPIHARIFSVADTLDAIITDRPYRKAMPLSSAKSIIVKERCSQFDPDVVDAFLSLDEACLMDVCGQHSTEDEDGDEDGDNLALYGSQRDAV